MHKLTNRKTVKRRGKIFNYQKPIQWKTLEPISYFIQLPQPVAFKYEPV